MLLLLLCVVIAVGDRAMALAPKILVLGGTGFIGSTVSRIAVDNGCQVTQGKNCPNTHAHTTLTFPRLFSEDHDEVRSF